jgi:ketosteroid isomerase-like protein
MNKHEKVFSRRQILGRAVGLSTLALTGGVGSIFAQEIKSGGRTTVKLDEKVLAANRELDRLLLEAHKLKDAAMVQGLFSESPDVFFISPGGSLNKGSDSVRRSFQFFFDLLESIHADIKEISYMPAGDGVIAVGTVIYSRKLKNAAADQRTVIWTDYRRMEGGKWVYFFRHAHWPVETSNPAATPK